MGFRRPQVRFLSLRFFVRKCKCFLTFFIVRDSFSVRLNFFKKEAFMRTKIEITEPTFEDCFADFLADKRAEGLSEKTIKTYRGHFDIVSKYADTEAPISVVTTRYMKRVVSAIAESDRSRNSVRAYTATLKSFFAWCKKEGLCDVDIPLFKGEEGIPETYTEEELRILLKRPNFRECSFAELRAWTIANLLVDTGMRAGSLRSIQNRDVRMEQRCIYLRHTKTRRTYAVPLSDNMAKILSYYMKRRNGKPEDFLFCEVCGAQMSENCLRVSMTRYNRSRGVERTGLHKFRHTFARMYLVECGGDSLKLQRMLGHSTLDMTKHYAKVFDADVISDFDEHSPLKALNKKNRIK